MCVPYLLHQALVEGVWAWPTLGRLQGKAAPVGPDGKPLFGENENHINLPVFNYVNGNLATTLSPHSYQVRSE